VSVALPFMARLRGIHLHQIGGMLALACLPHGAKFLWSPFVDTIFTRRTWYGIGVLLAGGGVVMAIALPVSLPNLVPIAVLTAVSQVGTSLMDESLDALLALSVPSAEVGRVTGWFQAGGLLGVGTGGGLALFLIRHLDADWMAGMIVGGVMLVCALPMGLITEPPRPPEAERFGQTMRSLPHDLISMLRSRYGLLGLLICLSPVGAGALCDLFSAIARDYQAGTHLVVAINGIGAGLAAALGALLGGKLIERMKNSRAAYAVAGLGMAFVALALAHPAMPRIRAVYVGGVLAYNLFDGVAYATFAAFVLETIGRDGALATKYTLFAALANNSLSYMMKLDGDAYHSFHLEGLFLCDGLLTIGAIVLLLIVVRVVGGRRTTRSST
jgi:MFS family permease